MILSDWISSNTNGCKSVVELGAGFFDKLTYVHPSVKTKIGIEIWQPYIDNAKYHDCIKVQGDIRYFDQLDIIKDTELDCVMMIDVLEHFDKITADGMLSIMKDHFNKILLMVPEGNHPQEEDVTGYGAHKYQMHRSTWSEADFNRFHEVIIDPEFHAGIAGKDSGAIFAIWKKELWNTK